MPAKSARKPLHTIDELEEQATIEEQLLEPGEWEAEWRAKAQETNANFWDRVALVPKHARDECMIYLYRVEPRVFNKQGDPSYIGKYPLPCTLDDIKEEHGGGRFEIYLKRGRRTLAGKYIFPIAGQPKFKEGQTDSTGRTLVASSSGQASTDRGSSGGELAEALKALVPLLKNEGGAQKAVETSVAVMEKGMTSALDMQAKAASAPNELMMKLAEKALTPQQSADPLTLIEKVVNIAAKLNPQRENPEPRGLEDVNDQLGFVKNLTGKTLQEIIAGEGKTPKSDPWIALATALVPVLPGIFAQIRQLQHDRFQWQAHMASRGLLVPAPGAPTATAAPATPPPTPVAAEVIPPPEPPPQPNGQIDQEQLIKGVIQEVIAYFKQGWTGDQCASSLAVHYGQALQMLAPVLSNRDHINAMIERTPELSVLESEPRLEGQPTWAEFVDEFFYTLNPEQAPPEDTEDDDEPEEIPPATGPRKRKKRVAADQVH